MPKHKHVSVLLRSYVACCPKTDAFVLSFKNFSWSVLHFLKPLVAAKISEGTGFATFNHEHPVQAVIPAALDVVCFVPLRQGAVALHTFRLLISSPEEKKGEQVK